MVHRARSSWVSYKLISLRAGRQTFFWHYGMKVCLIPCRLFVSITSGCRNDSELTWSHSFWRPDTMIGSLSNALRKNGWRLGWQLHILFPRKGMVKPVPVWKVSCDHLSISYFSLPRPPPPRPLRICHGVLHLFLMWILHCEEFTRSKNSQVRLSCHKEHDYRHFHQTFA